MNPARLRLTANMRFRFATPKLADDQLRIFAERYQKFISGLKK